jgi:hypothetical protein
VLAAVLLGGLPSRAAAAEYIAIDLNPSGFTYSVATGVSGGQQVGSGYGPATGGQNHALLWAGSADSVVDLHTFLPPGFTDSVATGIDSDGNIVGQASGPGVGPHAFLWEPVASPAAPAVPEPSALSLLGLGGLGLIAYGRLRRPSKA